MPPKLNLPIVLLLLWAQPSRVFADDSFVDDVAPILARRCLSCHNDKKTEGDLSMVDPRQLVQQGFIDESDAASSHLMELITPVDALAVMPKNSDPLTPDQIAAIRKWINGGATVPSGYRLQPPRIADRQWWSLQPISPERASPIAGSVANNIIDKLIDAKLAEKGLTRLPTADSITLIRRITYDLNGLPPTPAQVNAFVSANQADPLQAWDQLIDRLIDAPEFGEKWGQHWLDLARYAETHGYDKDQPRRNAWPYRDYVINSLNTDKPFGQFAAEQIAGDVVAADTGADSASGIIATGFLAAGPWDLIGHQEVGEGKLDGRIAKHLDRDEMLTAVFNVFQSTTIQCAQCHNHKFDPITAEDYYRVHAVFAGIDRANRIYAGLSPEQQSEKQKLQDERDELVGRRDRLRKQLDQQVMKQASTIDPRIETLTKKANQSPPPAQHGFHSTIANRSDDVKWIEVDMGKPVRLGEIRLIACYDDYNDIGAGFGFPVRFKVEATNQQTFTDENSRSLIDATSADYSNPGANPIEIDPGQEPVRIIRVTATKLAERRNDFILALGELIALQTDSDTNLARDAKVTTSDHIPPNSRWAPDFLVDGQFHRQSLSIAESGELKKLREKREAIVKSLSSHQDQIQAKLWRRRIAAINVQLKRFPQGQSVYAAATNFTPAGKFRPTEGALRPIHFLPRGDLRTPGKRMLPGAPKLWNDAPTHFTTEERYEESVARADLARYVTRSDNPLFWRSIANRIWQWTFGKTIVGTPNDFGRMGASPSHPELLDLLAAQLRDDPNQSIKSIVRLLVSTRAYRRASFSLHQQQQMAQNERIDKNNDYYWRASRRRLTAEEFRDSVLAVSGSLRQSDRGGPSFQDFVIKFPQHSPHYEYDLHDPNDTASHRRTIYRFVVRSQPQPMLTTLDCADPSISIARRDESTTALQALAQWNNRLIEVMARRFAKRLESETNSDSKAIDLACQLAWGRLPGDIERVPLMTLLQKFDMATVCRVVLNSSAMMYLD